MLTTAEAQECQEDDEEHNDNDCMCQFKTRKQRKTRSFLIMKN